MASPAGRCAKYGVSRVERAASPAPRPPDQGRLRRPCGGGRRPPPPPPPPVRAACADPAAGEGTHQRGRPCEEGLIRLLVAGYCRFQQPGKLRFALAVQAPVLRDFGHARLFVTPTAKFEPRDSGEARAPEYR